MMPSVRFLVPVFTGPMLLISAAVFAQEAPSDCVETGAMAYDNWTKVDSGGSGAVPDGVGSGDYIRCKACHGWDRMGMDGGYVRRSPTSSRPKAAHANGYTLGNQHPDFSVDGPT